MRVGLVGCGRVAERGYVPALRGMDASLVGVADPDRDRAARVAPGLPHHSCAEDLLEAIPVDLLVIASPTSSHVDDATTAASRGVQSLVEKPPATDASTAARLTQLSPPPWIGFNRRFEPRHAELRQVLLERDGRVELELCLTIQRGSWGAYVSSDGPLLDLGSHAVDLAVWLTGSRVERVRTRVTRDGGHEFELELGGSAAHITVAHDRPWREHLVASIGGEHIASFGVGGTLGRLRARVGLSGGSSLPELLRLQLRAAEDALRARSARGLATARDGQHVMAVLDAVRGSDRAGGDWIAVEIEGALPSSR